MFTRANSFCMRFSLLR